MLSALKIFRFSNKIIEMFYRFQHLKTHIRQAIKITIIPLHRGKFLTDINEILLRGNQSLWSWEEYLEK